MKYVYNIPFQNVDKIINKYSIFQKINWDTIKGLFRIYSRWCSIKKFKKLAWKDDLKFVKKVLIKYWLHNAKNIEMLDDRNEQKYWVVNEII